MISEIDLQDWNRSEHPVKLYDVPRNSVVSPTFNPDTLIAFSHIDGMYSYCKLFATEDVIHLSAMTDVFVWRKK